MRNERAGMSGDGLLGWPTDRAAAKVEFLSDGTSSAVRHESTAPTPRRGSRKPGARSHRTHGEALERLVDGARRWLRGGVLLLLRDDGGRGHGDGYALHRALREDWLILLLEVRVDDRELLLAFLPYLGIPERVPALLTAGDLLRWL